MAAGRSGATSASAARRTPRCPSSAPRSSPTAPAGYGTSPRCGTSRRPPRSSAFWDARSRSRRPRSTSPPGPASGRRRPTSSSSRCARACSSWGRSWRASAAPRSRFRAAAPSVPVPIDQHLKGLEAMGCTIRLERGYVLAEGPGGGWAPPGQRGHLRHPHRHGHREPDDGRGARKGAHHPRQLRARAGGRGARPRAQQDGSRGRRGGNRRHPHQGLGTWRARAVRPRDHPRPHRGGHVHGRGGDRRGGRPHARGRRAFRPGGARRQDARGRSRSRERRAECPGAPVGAAPLGQRDDRTAPWASRRTCRRSSWC